jgi:uncharacterized protein YggE|tara:strand:- start:4046 stop:4741 length:696 start_codon:yes stop_codon:yes gene_type:complete
MNKLIYCFISFAFININTLLSQDIRTITIEGEKTYNLSPNEVVIEIQYEEYYIKNDKVTIETIEKQILQILKLEKIKSNKITFGSISVIRPYDYKTKIYDKPRLKKSIYICFSNSEQYASLTRSLEKENLFDNIIKNFGISELRHTEKLIYLKKSRNQAFLDAKSKADLILDNSSQRTGKIIKIEEKNYNYQSSANQGFYATDNTKQSKSSGFKPIVISYAIVVTFEILDQ